jgi:hypothetical protein
MLKVVFWNRQIQSFGIREVSQNGNPARESKEAVFRTGGAPNCIPLTNINYCYPVIGQKNFYKDEAAAGYVQLKKGQTCLFPDNFVYNADFSPKNGNTAKAAFQYNKANSRLNFNFPAVNNQADYELASAAHTDTEQAQTVKTQNIQITNSERKAFSIDYMQQV